ncbi:EamA family transporter [Cellulomonas oligotrophica]|uniref:Membrane protein n=1 Tax=Cellulomonas oligotrophica TaxID=931536 RepID=A0A7Y9FH63_9CELL|nr:EamA family transporter [Cellulomonas oligotrophica]NYD87164.1 O-acetylserine/cysteine efflux transporter [Cellulomonas oligotrophica]GIG32050.1 membrane protein [Cellulomonas oligotrophica]
MPLTHRLLALVVAVTWGLNFLAIHATLAQMPPFLAGSVRFAVIAVPTLLLVPRPAVAWRWLLGYGFGFGVLQFAFLYLAMDSGMPTGLASLVLQSSAPFTVLLAAVLLRERLTGRQGLGVAVAVAGLAGIAVHRAQLDGGATLLPVLLTLCGGLGWALGNLANRQARPDSSFRLMLWMSVVPPVPMLALSLVVEGPGRIAEAFTGLTSPTGLLALAGLAYTVLVATLVGTGVWTWLMARHPSSVVAPFSMLVPVVGIGASWLVLREPTEPVELALGALVVGGVLLGSSRPRARPATAAADVQVPAAEQASGNEQVTGPEPARPAPLPQGTAGGQPVDGRAVAVSPPR